MLSHLNLSAALWCRGVPTVEVWKPLLERLRTCPRSKLQVLDLRLEELGCSDHHPTCLPAMWFSSSKERCVSSLGPELGGSADTAELQTRTPGWKPSNDFLISQNHLAETQSWQPLCGIFPFLRLDLNVGVMRKPKRLIKVLFIQAREKFYLPWRKKKKMWQCSRSRYLQNSFRNTEVSKNKVYWNKRSPERIRCQL